MEMNLDRHSCIGDVVLCMVRALRNLTGNDYIYADDEEGRNISFEEAEIICHHLKYTGDSAIDISDREKAWKELRESQAP